MLQEKFGDDPQSFEYFLTDICIPVNTIKIIRKCLSRFNEEWVRKLEFHPWLVKALNARMVY